jgi:S1-C subfamily serine protease
MEVLMTQLLSQVSDSIALLVANAAPLLTAIRIGQNRHVTGFLWRDDLVVTADQALPAASGYSIVLSNGALISAQPGPRDPVHNLASLRLDAPVSVTVPEPARSATIGALVLALGADFDGSPKVRLTTIHGFPRSAGAGSAAATITLDLAGGRVSHGGMVLDAEGLLLGMTSVSPDGDAIVVPHGLIARFVEAASATFARGDGGTGAMPRPMTPPTVQPIPQVAVQTQAEPVYRNGHAQPTMTQTIPGQTIPGRPGRDSRRGWLGVSLQPITVPEGLAHRAGQRTARQVVSVTRGGPADRAGLRSGDVLLALDGASTSGNHALRAFLAPDRIGSQVQVRLMRDGLVHTTVLTIAAQPE